MTQTHEKLKRMLIQYDNTQLVNFGGKPLSSDETTAKEQLNGEN